MAPAGARSHDAAHEPRAGESVRTWIRLQGGRGGRWSARGLAHAHGPHVLQRRVPRGWLDLQGLEGRRARARESALGPRTVVQYLLLSRWAQGGSRGDHALRARVWAG